MQKLWDDSEETADRQSGGRRATRYAPARRGRARMRAFETGQSERATGTVAVASWGLARLARALAVASHRVHFVDAHGPG